MKKIILFELNEVPMRVLNEFCNRNPNSALAQLTVKGLTSETYTEDVGPLSPWITWPTLHRGVNNNHHTIKHLGQPLGEIDLAFPPVWKIAAENGAKIGLFGSLHTFPIPKENINNYLFYMPDTFSPDTDAMPSSLEKFQKFNLLMARESFRNVSTKVNIKEAIKLIPYLNELGFTFSTYQVIIKQLLSEKMTSKAKLRRRTIQSILAFDAFLANLERQKPDLATFFTNHVASAMHRFWGAKYPNDFDDLGYGSDWVESFSDEIDHSMRVADQMIMKIKQFIDRNSEYTLIVASSMGQAAASGEPILSELIIHEPSKFFEKIGIKDAQFKQMPAMNPDYSFLFDSISPQIHTKLNDVMFYVAGKKIKLDYSIKNNFMHINLGINNINEKLDFLIVRESKINLKDAGLKIIETDFKQGCTGYHIPEGILIQYSNEQKPQKIKTGISSNEIAPAILSKIGVKVPSYMKYNNTI